MNNNLAQALGVYTDKPELGPKFFLNCLCDHYSKIESCDFGWYLYDYITEKLLIVFSEEERKTAYAKAQKNANAAKALLMDEALAANKITIETIKEALRNE